MKTFTNHTQGLRGINTKDGTVWLEPGASGKIDPDKIVGDLPDLGRKSDDAPVTDGEVDGLKAQVADLTKQVETLTADAKTLTAERDGLAKDKADLTKQVETLTADAKTLTAERDGLAKDKADLTKQVETLSKSK